MKNLDLLPGFLTGVYCRHRTDAFSMIYVPVYEDSSKEVSITYNTE